MKAFFKSFSLLILCFLLLPDVAIALHINTQELEFTDAEKQWIAENSVIRFTGDPNWLPYEAFENDGTYIGIVADHLKLIEKYTGLQFKPIPVKSWTEALETAAQSKVSVISGDAADVVLNKKFKPVDAYSKNPIVIIMDTEQNYVEDLQNIKDKKIAIIKGYGYTADIFKHYPDINFIEVENIQQGLLGVSKNQFDVLLATLSLASYHMAEMGVHNIKIVGKTPVIMDLTLFISKDKPLLHSIINKTLRSLSKTETQDILQGWIRNKYVVKTDYWLIIKVSGGLLLLVLIISFWNRKLKKEIGIREKAEAALRTSEERLDFAMEVANDGIWDWDI